MESSIKITVKDLNTQSQVWLDWCVETAREYYARGHSFFEAFISANGFKPEHEKYIREKVCNKPI